MNVLSLFDGMSCGQLALQRAGIKYDNYYASEIDQHAITITMKNHPNTIQIGDVRNVSGISDLPKIDLLIGGSPCQSFSFEGKRLGMATKDNVKVLDLDQYLKLKNEKFEFYGQSYLFWEYIRLLKETNPKYFLLENVKMDVKWKNHISSILDVEPILINSSKLSAAKRPRLYWTNIPHVGQPKNLKLTFKDVIDTDTKNYVYWKPEQMEKYFNKIYIRKDFYRIEEPNKKVQCLLAQFGQNHPKCWSDKPDVFRKLTPLEFERCQTVPDNYTDCGISQYNRYKAVGNGWTVDVIAHIFRNMDENYNVMDEIDNEDVLKFFTF